MKKSISKIATMALSLSAMSDVGFSNNSRVRKGNIHSSTPLTPKQLKARMKNKRAKKARKINRN